MSDTIVMPKLARLKVMEVKVPGYLNTLTLRLFKNDLALTLFVTTPDFVEADFPGYVAQGISDFGDPYVNADNQGESDTGVHTFNCTDTPDPSPQLIYGWYTTDGDDEIGPCARFADGPIALTGDGQSISIQLLFKDGLLCADP